VYLFGPHRSHCPPGAPSGMQERPAIWRREPLSGNRRGRAHAVDEQVIRLTEGMGAPDRIVKTSRSYSHRTLKLLWGRAGSRCAMPECRVELFAEATDYDPTVVIGEFAHVTAAADDGPLTVLG